MTKRVQQFGALSFGVIFVVVLLVLAVRFPNPTQFQYTVFRVVLALAAAGVAAMIPGFIEFRIATWLRAGGALAVFAIVFFKNPAALVSNENVKLDPNYVDVGIDEDRTIEQVVNAVKQERNVTIVFDLNCGDTVKSAVIEKGDHEGKNIKDFLENLKQRVKGKEISYHVEQRGERRYEIICP